MYQIPGSGKYRKLPALMVPRDAESGPDVTLQSTDVNSLHAMNRYPSAGKTGACNPAEYGLMNSRRGSSGFHQDIRKYSKTIFPGLPIEFICIVQETGRIEHKDGIFPRYGSRDRVRDFIRMFGKTGFTP
jgi:hypothetical protein